MSALDPSSPEYITYLGDKIERLEKENINRLKGIQELREHLLKLQKTVITIVKIEDQRSERLRKFMDNIE